MTQYIRVGNKVVYAEELCRLLNVTPKPGMPISVGQLAIGGTLEASVCMEISQENAFITTCFCPNGAPSIRLSHSEKDFNEVDGGEPPVRTFLYDRADGYVAYLNHNVRPEKALKKEKLRAMLVASGDADIIVDVYRQNQFVAWHDSLPTQN